jgi:SAM-dependent methyltransferase
MRQKVTSEFANFIDMEKLEVHFVAIVGGSSNDPEVGVVKRKYPKAEFHYFNLTNPEKDLNFHRLDINEDVERFLDNAIFDLVVSSQVLEHVWNHSNYFKLVAGIARPGGFIWVNCPKSLLGRFYSRIFSQQSRNFGL